MLTQKNLPLVIINQELINSRLNPNRYSNLDKIEPEGVTNNTNFLESISSGKVEYSSFCTIEGGSNSITFQSNILMNAGYKAYANHLSYQLSPDQLWYMIIDTIATAINLNPELYSDLLDSTYVKGVKKRVIVRNDYQILNGEWLTSLGLFEDKLKEFIPAHTQNFFTTQFTTSNRFTYYSSLLALMDAGSTFYEYIVMTRCGLESVEVLGTKEDYQLILDKLEWIKLQFGDELDLWVSKLEPVLESIIQSFDGNCDQKFWGDIIKIDNINGSGCPTFTGWLGYFTGYTQEESVKTIKTSKDYKNWSTPYIPSHITCVPFIWDNNGTEYPMKFVAGPIGTSYTNGTLVPEFGVAVASMEG